MRRNTRSQLQRVPQASHAHFTRGKRRRRRREEEEE
jgi:hypothetical protein